MTAGPCIPRTVTLAITGRGTATAGAPCDSPAVDGGRPAAILGRDTRDARVATVAPSTAGTLVPAPSITDPNGRGVSAVVATHCAACHVPLDDPHGWCGNCRVALCFPCGRSHYCTRTCPSQGCHAGLCVREVRGGVISDRWGVPAGE